MKKIILASQSVRRKELLEHIGLKFEICPSKYEEDMTLKMTPAKLAERLSLGKAQDVAQKYDDAIIVGADSIIAFKNKIFGKPKTPERAKEMLKELSGKAHLAITGFSIIDTKTGRQVSKSVETKVCFKNLSEKEIDAYIATGEPLDKAGAYGIQMMGGIFVKKVEGDFINIVGLSIFELVAELKKFGIEIL
jgi:septum formation protein